MNTISKDRAYTSNGYKVRIYTTDAGGEFPIHGAFKHTDGSWYQKSWTKDGKEYTDGTPRISDLTEALKPNGIPVDLPDPPEVDGYTWEARGWGWEAKNISGCCYYQDKQIWFQSKINNTWEAHGGRDNFYIEYIPLEVEEMTMEELCKELGRNIKIKQS